MLLMVFILPVPLTAFVASTRASSDFKKTVLIFITGVNLFSYSAYPSEINCSPPFFFPTINMFVVKKREVVERSTDGDELSLTKPWAIIIKDKKTRKEAWHRIESPRQLSGITWSSPPVEGLGNEMTDKWGKRFPSACNSSSHPTSDLDWNNLERNVKVPPREKSCVAWRCEYRTAQQSLCGGGNYPPLTDTKETRPSCDSDIAWSLSWDEELLFRQRHQSSLITHRSNEWHPGN